LGNDSLSANKRSKIEQADQERDTFVQSKMQFLDLPNEIFLALAEVLPLNDLNSLVQTDRHFYTLLNTNLYRYGADDALLWAADHGIEETARKALKAGADR
jgi:hypothetical protein